MKSLRLFLIGVAIWGSPRGMRRRHAGHTNRSSTGGAPATQRQAGPPGTRACPEPDPGRRGAGNSSSKREFEPDLAGWGPSDLQAAYNLPSSSKGTGQIVAIVDAYDNPNVASDLAEYRSHFGLPPANFTKYNQEGQTGNYPRSAIITNSTAGAARLISMSRSFLRAVRTARFIWSKRTDNNRELGTAEKEAVKLGAHIVSNSWDGATFRIRLRQPRESFI